MTLPYETWREFIEYEPDAVERLRQIAAELTKSDHVTEQTQLMFDFLYEAMDKQWPNLEDKKNWEAYARTVGWKQLGFPETWFEFVEQNSAVVHDVEAISAEFTRSDHSDDQTQSLVGVIHTEMQKRWPGVKDKRGWKAYAKMVARRQAPNLREKTRRAGQTISQPEDFDSVPDRDSKGPADHASDKEETEYIRAQFRGLTDDEQKILDAFANSKSERQAAEKLGMRPSTYRKRLWDIIHQIQPASVKATE